MPHTQPAHDLSDCIKSCLVCWRTCRQTALTHCLPLGGAHVEPEHFRLMLDCAAACEAAATLMANGSRYHSAYCALCAEICRACAASCETLGDMDACVHVCLECAARCDAMALHDMPPAKPRGGRHERAQRPS